MSYGDLLRSGASKTEIREYLTEGDQVAITIRIPKNLRDSAKEYAELRGMSFSALIRTGLIDELSIKR